MYQYIIIPNLAYLKSYCTIFGPNSSSYLKKQSLKVTLMAQVSAICYHYLNRDLAQNRAISTAPNLRLPYWLITMDTNTLSY